MSKLSATELQSKARDLVQREVNVCLSALISTLAGEAYSLPSGGPLSGLCEQAAEMCSPIQDFEEAAIQAGWKKRNSNTPDFTFWERAATANEVEAEEVDNSLGEANVRQRDTAELACELDGLDPYDREVFEHWAVSQWFGDKLKAQGEKVDDDFAGMVVWARCTSGQAIYCDGVVERITAELHAN